MTSKLDKFFSLTLNITHIVKKIGVVRLIIILFFLLTGTYFRFVNLPYQGFYFDTVYCFYNWGNHSFEEGVGDFWRNYDGLFDYLPGAVYYLLFIRAIAEIFGGGEDNFVAVLKLFNFLFEVAFTAICFLLAYKKGKWRFKNALTLASIVYSLPSIWFIGIVWGQIDTLSVTLSLFAALLLYKNNSSTKIYKNNFFLSGLIMGISIWIKWQAVFILPFIVTFFASRNKPIDSRKFIFGFIIIPILVVPQALIADTHRFLGNLLSPLSRGNAVSGGAPTFWQLLGFEGSNEELIVKFGDSGLTVGTAGILIFLVLMLFIAYKILGFNLLKFIKEIVRKKLALLLTLLTLGVGLFFSTLDYMLPPDQHGIQYFNFTTTNTSTAIILGLLIIPTLTLFIIEFILYIRRNSKKQLSFKKMTVLLFLTNFIYFMLMMNMHSRYLHTGILTGILVFILIKNTRVHWAWGITLLLLHTSYFINQLEVFRDWNDSPTWPRQLSESFAFDIHYALSIVNLLCLIAFIFMSMRYIIKKPLIYVQTR